MPKTWSSQAHPVVSALIAEEALRRGDNAVATARDPASVTARFTASERLLAVSLDVTDEAQAHAAAEAAIQRFGRMTCC